MNRNDDAPDPFLAAAFAAAERSLDDDGFDARVRADIRSRAAGSQRLLRIAVPVIVLVSLAMAAVAPGLAPSIGIAMTDALAPATGGTIATAFGGAFAVFGSIALPLALVILGVHRLLRRLAD